MNTTEPAGWITEAWEWASERTQSNAAVIQDHFPHVAENGKYDRCAPEWWTAGFWPGLLWLVHGTGDDNQSHLPVRSLPTIEDEQEMDLASELGTHHEPEMVEQTAESAAEGKPAHYQLPLSRWAESCERQLEHCLYNPELVDHDLGFIWLLSGVARYIHTGDPDSRRRGLLAANLLAARFNVRGNYIRAWNFGLPFMDTRGVAIIDSMMNLPLLYWASLETGDPRYRSLAIEHADTIAGQFVREDHSICHIVEFDASTGARLKEHGGQGFGPGSAWARGTAWALYGFALSYAYTGKQCYLEISRQTADFFLGQLGERIVPYWDFRAPEEHRDALDSSAAAIAASGLLELARHLPVKERGAYEQAGQRIIRGLYEQYSTRQIGGEGLITHGTVHYPERRHLNVPIIYGDYYFMEALIKLRGGRGLFTPGAV
ncbi:glycoside hydrolase family protein [Paenibacillus wulumuqiensis]|uniref:glycoside hydrolase family 88 protein n=1 Tax=Paenibacillus wulumuqiensis TaxID=1567107 RepID=UPI00061A0B46|nr:glycoside hydrolase family 88 protein [Paenibacillus wulumuqiensis]